MKLTYEAVVVGAGPAGCSVAIHLKKLGIDVLLLDKSFFPRDKICGDGIPLKCFPLLEELGVKRRVLLERGYPIRQLNIHAPTGEVISYGNPNDETSSKSVCLVRKEFDFLLLNQAKKLVRQVALGKEVIQIDKVLKNAHILLLKDRKTGNQMEISARMIIGADGAHSIVSRQKNMVRPGESDQFIGLRAYCDNDYFDQKSHIIYDRLTLPGYVWLFPVSETRANIGMVVSKDYKSRTGQSILSIFKKIVTSHSVFQRISGKDKIFYKTKGFPLNLGSDKGSRVKDGVILVGDAAAFTNPLTGGGIYNAILSGKQAATLAANCLKKKDTSKEALSTYENWWREKLGPSFYYSSLMKKFLKNEKRANWCFRKCSQNRIFANLFMSIYGRPVARFFFLNPLNWLKVMLIR